MTENINIEELIDPDKKKERHDRYEEAHKIAKKFLQANPSADSKTVYASADLAVKLYSENASIRAATSLSKFVQLKIQSGLKQNKGKKPKPRISEDVKRQIIEAKESDPTLSQRKLAEQFNINQSTVARILKAIRKEEESDPSQTDFTNAEKPVNRIINIINTVINSGADKFYFQGDIDGYSFSFSVGRHYNS